MASLLRVPNELSLCKVPCRRCRQTAEFIALDTGEWMCQTPKCGFTVENLTQWLDDGEVENGQEE